MSGLTLYASPDLRVLAARFVEVQGTTANPLVRRTVVVPNVVVGQWFEQEVARQTGRAGYADGVAANLDTIFLDGLLGRLLYDDAHAMERWKAPALGVALYEAEPAMSWDEAQSRGAALARVVTLRGDEAATLLAPAEYDAERRLLARRDAEGFSTPSETFERDGVLSRDDARERLMLFGTLASPAGSLAARVVRRVADSTDVDLYAALALRELLEGDVESVAPETRSLGERWGAAASAQLGLWRTHARPDRVEWIDASDRWSPSKRAVLAAVSAGSPAPSPGDAPAFLEVHRTSGLARQVEVARDAVLHALEETGARPHQVRVVTPDPAGVAALMATYWQPSVTEEDGAPRLQYEVSDPGVGRRSARLDAFARLLRTLDAHMSVHDVASLLGEPSLLSGLGMTRADAERIVELATEGRVSLGLDSDDPARAGVFSEGDDAGSWRRLVDRVALATCFEPSDGSSELSALGVADDLDAVSRFSDLVGLVARASHFARSSHPLSEWAEAFAEWARVIERDERVRDPSLDRLLARVGTLGAGSTRPVGLEMVRGLVDSLVAGAGGSALLGRGGVSVIDAVGGAIVPYELTCVVGLDDELLPEPTRRVSELGEARASDPDPRAEFRLALLNLLASTTTRVMVFTSDRRVVDGSDLPESLPLVELRDALAQSSCDGSVMDVRQHPCFGFTPATQAPGDVAPAGADAAPFSLDPVHAASATQLANRGAAVPEDDLALVEVAGADEARELDVDVEGLVSFLRNPQRVFLRDVYSSARVIDPGERERPDVPYLDAGGPLSLYGVREHLLRLAVETGVDPVVPTGPDSSVATVAAGFRARAALELGVDELARLARYVRSTLADADARLAPVARRPAVVRGLARAVSRPPLDLYDTGVGSVLFAYTSSRNYGSRLIGLFVRQALLTVETRSAVSAVLLRAARDAETQQPEERPYLVSTWEPGDAVAAARALLDALIDLYDRRWARLPLHQNRTTLATSPRFGATGAGVVGSPRDEWFRSGAFAGGSDMGESLTPENRVLLPFSYAELAAVHEGEFLTQSAALTTALAGLEVTATVSAEPWTARLAARRLR